MPKQSLNININCRNRGFYYHKQPHGSEVQKAKACALRDISEFSKSNEAVHHYKQCQCIKRIPIKIGKQGFKRIVTPVKREMTYEEFWDDRSLHNSYNDYLNDIEFIDMRKTIYATNVIETIYKGKEAYTMILYEHTILSTIDIDFDYVELDKYL
jgi:hypothetical protein